MWFDPQDLCRSGFFVEGTSLPKIIFALQSFHVFKEGFAKPVLAQPTNVAELCHLIKYCKCDHHLDELLHNYFISEVPEEAVQHCLFFSPILTSARILQQLLAEKAASIIRNVAVNLEVQELVMTSL